MRRALVVIVLCLAPASAQPQGGEPLGPEFRVNTYTTHIQSTPAAAADGAGNFVVVWQSYLQAGAHFEVFGRRYGASGAPLGAEFRVNTQSGVIGGKTDPSAGADTLGNFVVAWTSWFQDGSVGGIFGQRFAASGTPQGPEFRVNTYVTGNQMVPAVAVASGGSFVVVWRSADGSEYGIFGQRYAASGAPVGPEFRVNTHTLKNQDRPAVATDAAGNFVVVWQSNEPDGSVTDVFGQRYAASGARLGPEFRVNSFTTRRQGHATVASDAAGNFVVVWESTGIFGQRFAASGAPLGPEFRVTPSSTPLTGFPTAPAVASDPAGDFVVGWQRDDGSFFGTFAQRFAASGAPLGPEFRVNTFTTFLQMYPTVAVGGDGTFVMVWQSYQDGSASGIYGQRYGPISKPAELTGSDVE